MTSYLLMGREGACGGNEFFSGQTLGGPALPTRAPPPPLIPDFFLINSSAGLLHLRYQGLPVLETQRD